MLHVGDMAGFQAEMKSEKPDIQRWQLQGFAIPSVITLQAHDEFVPEIVGFRFIAFSNAVSRPGFDGETGSGSDIVIGAPIDFLQIYEEPVRRWAAKRPLAQLVPIQAEHFTDVSKPLDVGTVVRKPMAFGVAGLWIDGNTNLTGENRASFHFLLFGCGIHHAFRFQRYEVIGEHRKLGDQIRHLGCCCVTILEPLGIRIPLDDFMLVNLRFDPLKMILKVVFWRHMLQPLTILDGGSGDAGRNLSHGARSTLRVTSRGVPGRTGSCRWPRAIAN